MSPSSSTPSTESLFRLGLNAALPISEEATTSRVVVNNEILRTVVFTFDAGQVLTEHSSPRAVVVTLLEGEMDFSIGERTERMGAGDVIYLAPGDRHALTAVTPCRMQLVMVDVDKVGARADKERGELAAATDQQPARKRPPPCGVGCEALRSSPPPHILVRSTKSDTSSSRVAAPQQPDFTWSMGRSVAAHSNP